MPTISLSVLLPLYVNDMVTFFTKIGDLGLVSFQKTLNRQKIEVRPYSHFNPSLLIPELFNKSRSSFPISVLSKNTDNFRPFLSLIFISSNRLSSFLTLCCSINCQSIFRNP